MIFDTDRHLVELIVKGDYHSFQILYETYYSGLCAVAKGMVKSEETAHDLVSDIFVRIWERPEDYLHVQSLKPYLIRSVRNTCLNYLNRMARQKGLMDREEADKILKLIPAGDPDPHGKLIADELEDNLNHAINSLPPECARVFMMSRKEYLSNQEIAEKLNISEHTVKAQLYKAVIRIRAYLFPK